MEIYLDTDDRDRGEGRRVTASPESAPEAPSDPAERESAPAESLTLGRWVHPLVRIPCAQPAPEPYA